MYSIFTQYSRPRVCSPGVFALRVSASEDVAVLLPEDITHAEKV